MNFDERGLRDALGLFATGVCLVSIIDDRGEAMAITVNSFSSVSLDPPLVLWSLQKDADTYDEYAHAPQFSIAMLDESQEGHSSTYAQKDQHALAPEHFYAGENGAPLIHGALANFECTLEQALDGGDHTILLGRVTRIVKGDSTRPLLFFGGRYERLP